MTLIGSFSAARSKATSWRDGREPRPTRTGCGPASRGRPRIPANPARLHADFGRLRRHGDVREDADPQAALTTDVARDRAAGRLDLARGDPPGSMAFRPAPKFSSVPPLALPWMRPLKALRNLVRFGCSICQFLSGDLRAPGGRPKSALPSSDGPGRAGHDQGFRP